MRVRIILFVFLLFGTSYGLMSQTVEDAISMSMRDYFTSARVVGTGSAMGAIGGDYGAININPANIGTFRNSYFTGSLGLNSIVTESEWNDLSLKNKENNSYINLPNLGFVTSGRGNGKWETINFGLGFNRVHSNTRYINTEGIDKGSIVQRWAAMANDVKDISKFDDFELLPAWESYALGYDEDGAIYFSDYGDKDYLNKEVYEEIRGGINEIALSFGGNYDNKLMLGMNLGLPFFNNRVSRVYHEYDDMTDNIYESVTYEESYETSGIGFNFGLGAIYMPVYNVRIGLSFQSPTWFSLGDNYRTRVHFQYDDPYHQYIPEDANTDQKPQTQYIDYKFTTPMRIGGQIGWIIGRMGFIDVDVEYADYSMGRFNTRALKSEEKQLNSQISRNLGKALSIRTGGEIALDELRLRLGIGLQQDPYLNNNKFNPTFSGGLGFRAQTFFIDLAYRYSQVEGNYYPYVTFNGAHQPEIKNKYISNNFILTLGFDL